jgi:hypothetical protein
MSNLIELFISHTFSKELECLPEVPVRYNAFPSNTTSINFIPQTQFAVLGVQGKVSGPHPCDPDVSLDILLQPRATVLGLAFSEVAGQARFTEVVNRFVRVLVSIAVGSSLRNITFC